MGLFSVFEKIINIENINLGCKKTREEDYIKKLNAIFAYVVLHLINGLSINEEIPKDIVKFIKSDIEKELSLLWERTQVQIAKVKRENDFQRENYIQSNMNNINSARAAMEYEKKYDGYFALQKQQIEQNSIAEQQKVLKEIISQYQNGTRLNEQDFTTLRSNFKNDQQIEDCWRACLAGKNDNNK